jgi:NAD+ synthase (glutamine-hydrolysing)
MSSSKLACAMDVQMNKFVVATCNLNQWALDFDGNLERIVASIKQAKELGARYRLGPELEITGYSCEDHFLELDTMMHSDQSLAVILDGDLTDGILCDIGCPILHNNVRYNCRVFCLNRKIVLIRPKVTLADDGNYREKRFFTPWDHTETALHDHILSDVLRKVTNQTTVPMGVAIIATEETTIASEICEELWAPKSPHINFYLAGVEIISNGSGSHHGLRRMDARLTLMQEPTRKCGGAYMYANSRGCDGNRLYFDGGSLICLNGDLVAQASQFSLMDVEVITAVVDLDAIRSYRQSTASFQEQSSQQHSIPTIDIRHFSLRQDCERTANPHSLRSPCQSPPITRRLHSPEEECCMGPACWMWDYLRRSGASGFLLPLSGGADSAAAAAIVRVMCIMASEAALAGNSQVIADIKKLFSSRAGGGGTTSNVLIDSLSESSTFTTLSQARVAALTTDSDEFVARNTTSAVKRDVVSILADELSMQIMHTVYLGTTNSSNSTRDRAKRLASAVRSYHNTVGIDDIVASVLSVFSTFTGRTPRYVSHGGTMAEDLALQNIQARLRMVMSYLCAQLFPWLRGNQGFLLVLSSGNVDEALRGYMTKYDCSSGDLNPIGGISKVDLKRMLMFIAQKHNLPVLDEIANAVPTVRMVFGFLFIFRVVLI